MDASNCYREFRIEVRPSPNEGEYQARFLADGEDIIPLFGRDVIGLDPDEVLVRPCPLYAGVEPHRATVAMCGCGVLGCGDIDVDVVRTGEYVEWRWGDRELPGTLRFLATRYDAELERAIEDTSWEPPDRATARLLGDKVDQQLLVRRGLTYSWASARVRNGKFTVSLKLEPGPYQILVHLPWLAESVEETVKACSALLAGNPAAWPDVEWCPQQGNLGPPVLAGPAWRRGL